MIGNYIKIALRNIQQQKMVSIINLSGLTIGMTVFILIAGYIRYEFSFDTQHEKYERIYRVSEIQVGNDFRGTNRFALSQMPLLPAMKEQFPEIENGPALQVDAALLADGDHVFSELGLFADEHALDVFDWAMLEGDGKAVLKDPGGIIINEKLAKKYFGNTDAVGRTLLMDNQKQLTVLAVMQNPPKNQHFNFDFITSWKNYDEYENDTGNWNSNNYHTYVVLKPGQDYKLLEPKLSVFEPVMQAAMGEFKLEIHYFLQPLKDIHLRSNINFEIGANGDIRYIWLASAIALVILLLALINYANLTTVKTPNRVLEAGVRKVLGAKRVHLVLQYLSESILLVFSAFLLALFCSEFLLKGFNQLLNSEIPGFSASNFGHYAFLLAVALLVGALAGLYPAVISAAISPLRAVKGAVFNTNREKNGYFRNALVITQFSAVIILAVGSVIIHKQLHFIQTKKTGLDRDQVAFIPYANRAIFDKIPVLKNELSKLPGIRNISFSAYLPLNLFSQGVVEDWEGNDAKDKLWIYRNYVDENFLDVFKMELSEGRNFLPEIASDTSNSYILNEAAVNALGWTSAVGKSFADGKVIGVVKDFHFQPFDFSIEPLFLKYRTSGNFYGFSSIILKLDPGLSESALVSVHNTLKKLVPGYPVEPQFLDVAYHDLYQAEKRFGKAFNIFTFIALFIACIGLFGLVTFHINQHTKEIGIRKVLGATTTGIVGLLSKDFLKLVIVAIVIASPIAWYFMNRWLQGFAYRIDIQWWVFAAAGFSAILIAFLTVGFQSMRAALANPVKSLRSE